ncbi:transcriptional regulator with XRE-family HTH domain [Clostridium saccharoperbutylacetonicum]|uniref:Uncharacterized protein n=1 Tax=Clostridium saccharoperbutylacetonicum N1-4(HMT) TaxID=931276 RepID=M1MCL2_9CLOT|nr:hypothetical protein [Clostridium saccharoperbutylacetonicum]AGF55649.1 hypothetical protein Cspa_c18790 [Clostridium saccharoperbutylacetonicum N1-4(HMT)]NRT63626.1 transcriptional regulator with XRE-family HTH domain [Clostridium saccharoperbutylacetonicum]NSB26989.1 transcriptional regulator with XRE-family HTH domain [Clostridium saccharoperbutylacetonicum]NSB40473.1 transcriptional regulator with XRE-family HTH domain [Clostridium saccharoperbutylacetonicum]
MGKRNSLFAKLKELTGVSYEKIAKEFGVSKQHISQSFSNHLMTYENSNKFMALNILNLKINEYQEEIKKLENFKGEISNVKGGANYEF